MGVQLNMAKFTTILFGILIKLILTTDSSSTNTEHGTDEEVDGVFIIEAKT